jgi:hypothetical protein
MSTKEILLSVVYLVGAVVDAAVSIPMLGAAFSGKYNWQISYFIASGAMLMIGWTVLLIWAACQPVARRTVLLITLIPIIGILTSNCIINSQMPYPVGDFLFLVLGGASLSLLYIFAYSFTGPSKQN